MIEVANVREFILFALGDPTFNLIRANQNGDLPLKPYGTYQVIFTNGFDSDENFEVNEEGLREVKGNRSSNVDVNFYGPGAFRLANILYNALSLETVIDKGIGLGLHFSTRQTVRDLSQIENKQREERAMVEFSMLWTSVVIEDVSLIETVEVTGDIPGVFPFSHTISVAKPL